MVFLTWCTRTRQQSRGVDVHLLIKAIPQRQDQCLTPGGELIQGLMLIIPMVRYLRIAIKKRTGRPTVRDPFLPLSQEASRRLAVRQGPPQSTARSLPVLRAPTGTV